MALMLPLLRRMRTDFRACSCRDHARGAGQGSLPHGASKPAV